MAGDVMARDVAGVGMTRNMEVAGGFVARGMAVAEADMGRDWYSQFWKYRKLRVSALGPL